MRRYDVVTIGAASRDIFFRSADFRVINDKRFRTGKAECVALGSKIDVATMVSSTGGGATNAATTFARFGRRVAFLGKVGEDADGEKILQELAAEGIDIRFVQKDPDEPTALTVLLSTVHHGRTALVYRGASADLTLDNVRLNSVAASWLYVTSLGGKLALLRAVLGSAHRRKMLAMVNPGEKELRHRRALLKLLRRAHIVLLNREEANTLLGTTFLPVPALLSRLRRVLPVIVVVTDEAKGAWAVAGSGVYHSATHRSLTVVERTGAGDAFGSGFLSGLLVSGGDIRLGLQFGTANAESVMRNIGAKKGILRRAPAVGGRVSVRRVFLNSFGG